MRLLLFIAAISAAVLGYEIALMRALSVARWHHFAYMVVSVALLGFGASGTVLSLWGRRLVRHFDGVLPWLAAGFAVAIPASFALAQRVPFDIFQLAWDWRQSLYLFACYLVLFVPFLLGATCIGLAFVRETQRAHTLYFWNLLGSGIGSAGMVGAMFVAPVERLPLVAFWAAAAGALAISGKLWRAAAIGGPVLLCLFVFSVAAPLQLNISEYKSLRLMTDAGARVVEERSSPLGTIHVLDGPAIRLVSGLSLAYTGEQPRQRAILVDADSASAINHLDSPEQAMAFDYTTSALPYHLLERPTTLVIGAGGGSDVLLARYHGCPSITALEFDPVVAGLMTGSQADFAQHLYEQPGIRLVAAEARGFLARTPERYDLIQLPLVESLGASSAGVYALNESYLYTVEAMQGYLDHLTDRGVLSITRWLKTPPRDVPRILATLTEAMRRWGGDYDMARHVIAIRGMFTATILASRRPFSRAQLDATRAFCRERCFDLIFLDQVWMWRRDGPSGAARAPVGVNEFNQLPEPYYYNAAMKLFYGEPEDFIRSCPFDIRPTTDDRPYHSLTQRWRGIRYLRETLGDQWVRYADWGYLVLLATLAQAAAAGLVLILLPLLFLRRAEGSRGGRLATCAYFACLGVAYMFIEIVMMQKLSLFLASPIYAAAVVLASFMVFSGLGSLAAGRLSDAERRAARLGILGVGLSLWAGMDWLLSHLSGVGLGARMMVATSCAGALAFFMGMPFPSGLRRVAGQVPSLTPWAWGVNGCASVVGATLAMVLAVSVGFRMVLLLAFALYALAGAVLPRIAPGEQA